MKNDDVSLGVLPMKDEKDKKDQKKEMRELLEATLGSFQEQLEIIALKAKMDKAYFDALVNAGFTQDQAMQILKAREGANK